MTTIFWGLVRTPEAVRNNDAIEAAKVEAGPWSILTSNWQAGNMSLAIH